tara:strand:- start:2051 stop:3535 length:1485 start_codon:yes stop_codon:yes gene_type:complete
MTEEFVIGLDSSTQSNKAVAWSKYGICLGEGRASIPMAQPAEGHFEQDPEDWWHAACAALRALGQEVDLSLAKGLAVSNQRETIGFLDGQGAVLRPAIVWLDERAKSSVSRFSKALGADFLHLTTGKPPDITPAIYRLHWLQNNSPEVLASTAKIIDVHSFLSHRLTGKMVASWTSADPMGVFDITAKDWSAELIESLHMHRNQFVHTISPGSKIGQIHAAASQATGLPVNMPVIAAGGDGQCAGLGANAMRHGTVYLNLGTAIITGAWSAEPRISKEWRTMISPTGAGYFLEGILRAGTFFIDWFIENFAGGDLSTEHFLSLEKQAQNIPVGSDGVVVCPYLSGCMNPHWDLNARATFSGLQPDHGVAHLYRAVLEALTGEIVRCIKAMQIADIKVTEIVAVGGGANSPLWRKMISDASGIPVTISASHEASSLGAGITVAKGIGWYRDFAAAAAAMCSTKQTLKPDKTDCAQWQTLFEKQDKLNRFVVSTSD